MVSAGPATRWAFAATTACLVTALGLPTSGASATTGLPSISATYAVGDFPGALAISPDGRRIVTANSSSSDASVIDRRSETVANVASGAAPIDVVVSPDGARAYLSNWSFATPGATTLDLTSVPAPTFVRTTALDPLPGGLALSGDGGTLLITAHSNRPSPDPAINQVVQIQASNGAVLRTSSVSGPRGIFGAPNGTQFLVTSIGTVRRNAVSIVTAGSTTVSNVDLVRGFSGIGAVFSPDSRLAYVAMDDNFGSTGPATLAVVDMSAASLVRDTVLASAPGDIAIAPDGSRVFVTLGGTSSSLAVFDASGALLATTPLTGTPDLVEVSMDGRYVLVTTTQGNLVVLDGSGTQVLTTLALGGDASDMQVAATGTFAAIAIGGLDRVTIVSLPPAEASGPQVPTAALQQYAPAPGEACGVTVPASAGFPALASMTTDGWAASWAWWPNGGLGGAVCTRQPYYTAGGTWSVR